MSSFETLAFFRGVSARYDARHPTVHAPRRDRRPKDSSSKFHTVADEWFRARFGIAYRSQSLLLTSRLLTAQTYAATPEHVMRVVPLSPYRYCWSPNAVDLLFAATKLKKAVPREIEDHLASLDYCEGGLADAHESGNEVMLFCEKYIAIPVHLISVEKGQSSAPVILVDKFAR